MNSTRHGLGRNRNEETNEIIIEKIHPDTIPFKVNGSSLIPLFGDQEDLKDDDMEPSSLALQAGQNVTLSFSGVIALQPEKDNMMNPAMVVTPIVGGNYTVRLTGEGFMIFNVTATS